MAKVQSHTTAISKKLHKDQEAPLYGDILEAILSRVPLLHLLPACHVSKSWNRAVSSSVRHFHRNIKPWLILHTQNTRSPYHYETTARAYDPASHVWVDIHSPPSIRSISTLRSSHSSFLYMLSPSKFSFSIDPLHHTWHHVEPPIVWRMDPIVALVGHQVIVAGGTCDYEDDPLAVEIYDIHARAWDKCDSMPAFLKDSAASTWLSVAVDETKMYVMEKSSGVTYSFDPNSKTWFGPYDLRPNGSVFHSVIGFADDGRLILVGAEGSAEDLKGVKLWEVNGMSFERKEMVLVGEMPEAMVEKLKGESGCVAAVGISCMGNLVCLHNPWEPRELILCERVDGGCRWGSVRNIAAANEGAGIMQRLVVTCSNVGMPDLHKAVQVGALKIL